MKRKIKNVFYSLYLPKELLQERLQKRMIPVKYNSAVTLNCPL